MYEPEPTYEEVEFYLANTVNPTQLSFSSPRQVFVEFYLKNTTLGRTLLKKVERARSQAELQRMGLNRQAARKYLGETHH